MVIIKAKYTLAKGIKCQSITTAKAAIIPHIDIITAYLFIRLRSFDNGRGRKIDSLHTRLFPASKG